MLNQIKTVLLLGALMALMLLAGALLGGRAGLTIALVLALVMNFATYWFSDKIVLKMYRAKKASKKDYPELHSMVEDLAKEAKLPKPKIYIVPQENANAFATGRNPKNAAVACTQGILKILDKNELKGVLAHEMGHIKNRDILVSTIAATIAAVISYVAMMARFAAIFGGRDDRGGNILGMLVLAILTPLIAAMLQLAISRSREYLADATGARLSKHPKDLARALGKLQEVNRKRPMKIGSPATSSLFITNPFSAKGLISLFSTHPPMEERIKRLEAMKI